MAPNWLLIWTVIVSCSVTVLLIARSKFRSPIRLSVPAIVLAVLGISYYQNPDTAGYYSGAVWFFLMLLPGVLFRWSNSLLGERRYGLAVATSRIAAFLHPFDGARDQARLVNALRQLHSGNESRGLAILDSLEQKPTSTGRAAAVIKIRFSGEWGAFLQSMDTSPYRQQFLSDPLVADLYLQSLGETGRLDDLFASYQQFVMSIRRRASATMVNLSRLKIAAFSGREDLAELICKGPLSHVSQETARFWIATAIQAKGETERAKKILAELTKSQDEQIAKSAHERIICPVDVPQELPESAQTILGQIEETVSHESRYALFGQLHQKPTWTTTTLAALLVIAFIMEMLHGPVFDQVFGSSSGLSLQQKLELMLENSRDIENLKDCGALVLPWSTVPGEYSRVVTAAFLHFGLTHLTLNLFGLLLFGRRLERVWGPVVTGVCYLLCAVLSIALMTFFVPATESEGVVMAGASGGVMGLIGCLLGYMGRGMLLRRNSYVSRDFNLLFFMVLLQFLFDQATPNVSSACHLTGLMIGVFLGFLVGLAHEMPSGKFPRASRRPAS